MEENQFLPDSQPVFDLQIDQTASKNLVDAARWARFIAIFCFIMMGCALLLIFASPSGITYRTYSYVPGLSSSEGTGIIIAVLVFIFLMVTILLVFLLRGAVLIKRGVETKNQSELVDGLRSLKIYFTIYGIAAIVVVLLNLIQLVLK